MKQFLALLAVSFSVSACNRAGATAVAAASTPDASAKAVAVKVGSRSFSNAELDSRVKADLDVLQSRATAAETQLKAQMEDIRNQVGEQEYNLRKKALTEVLFDMEAQAQGVPRNELVAREVTAKALVLPSDLDKLWEEVKSGAKGSTRETMQPQLQQMVMQRKTEAQLGRYQRELFKKYKVAMVGLQPTRKSVVVPANAPILGPADAPVTIVEFTDYQCPYCQKAQQYVDRVMDAYKGKVRLVYQEFPLDFHGQAKPAGVAARCAGEQGKFWEMHNGMLRAPGAFDEKDLKGRAAALSLDGASFGTCLASGKFDAVIQQSIDAGKAIGVSGTPTFLINGRSFSGAQPFEAFEHIIEEELTYPGTRAAKQQ